MSDCGIGDYALAAGAVSLFLLIGKGFMEDHRNARRQRDMEELVRLRALYTPGYDQELRERARLAELERQYTQKEAP
jgi:hypothetical protein